VVTELLVATTQSQSPSLLATVGGDIVVITGSNFSAQCRFNNATLGRYALTLLNCSATVVYARTPAGSGVGWRLSFSTAGQDAAVVSAVQAVSYAPPRIADVAGDVLLPPFGKWPPLADAVVLLSGSNFGPPGTPIAVTYSNGVDGQVYTPTCSLASVNHTLLQCVAVAGVGVGHVWSLTVDGQPSAPSTQTTSYAPPTLTQLGGAGANNANTNGGQIVLLRGSNFGPVGLSILITVVYSNVSVRGGDMVGWRGSRAWLGCVCVVVGGGGGASERLSGGSVCVSVCGNTGASNAGMCRAVRDRA
jgi:hypothetical protein